MIIILILMLVFIVKLIFHLIFFKFLYCKSKLILTNKGVIPTNLYFCLNIIVYHPLV